MGIGMPPWPSTAFLHARAGQLEFARHVELLGHLLKPQH
jgi:hypothetical protein